MSSRRQTRQRKSTSKTTPKEEKDDEIQEEEEDGDFEDSGSSFAPENSSRESESSADEFQEEKPSEPPNRKSKTPVQQPKPRKSLLPRALKILHSKKELPKDKEDDEVDDEVISNFSIKNLTDEQKQLPSFLDLSESDSDDSNDEAGLSAKKSSYQKPPLNYPTLFEEADQLKSTNDLQKSKTYSSNAGRLSDSDSDQDMEDVLPGTSTQGQPSIQVNRFQDLQEQNQQLEDAKKSLELYAKRKSTNVIHNDVSQLLAMGEPETVPTKVTKKTKRKLKQNQSDSDDEDMEEVADEVKSTLPKGGLQVVVDFPSDRVKGKSKPIDLEMMMKRRINRIRKEYQVYMHKVHVLCWIAHGNYVNKILNGQDIMGAALSLIPSEKCYPENRVNIKYIEQITKWFNGVMDVMEDKKEQKVKFNKPQMDKILLSQMGLKIVSSKKNMVLIFIAMLRALGIKCRLVLSFVLVSLRPSESELCSLAMKKTEASKGKKTTATKSKTSKSKTVISQLDGANDEPPTKKKTTLSTRKKASSSSTSSYWDQITKDILPEKNQDSKRVSHRQLAKNSNIEKEIKKEPSTPKSSNIHNNTTLKINSISPAPVQVVSKDTTSSKSSKTQLKEPTSSTNDAKKTRSSKKSVPDKNIEGPSSTSDKRKPSTNSRKSVREKSNEVASSSNDKRKSSKKEDPKKTVNENPQTSPFFPKKTIIEKRDYNKSKTATNSKAKKPGKSPYFNENTVVEKCQSAPKKANTVPKESNVRLSKRKNTSKSAQVESEEEFDKPVKRTKKVSESSDKDFKPTMKRKSSSKAIDRRVLSSDDESNANPKRKGLDCWCEVYMEEEEQWIAIDVVKGIVHCVNELYKRATHPVSYVVAWDENGYLKDVTRRYVPQWNTTTRKLRVDQKWYDKAIAPWLAPLHLRDRREDEQLDRIQLDAPLPTTVGEYKNHPLYALERHLLKFEVIYPPNAPTLGFVRKEPVYARECVYVCRSRDTWLKEAKVVKLGEKPYKIVKARPKYDRLSGNMITDIPLEIFGPWQCEDYVPPAAENGEVPRNAYGNVELFKACMLPKGTVHLQLAGLNKVARKLGIDCAPAMTGFDYHSGWSHPVYDGFVICEEFKEQAIEAWEKEQEEAEIRAREKIEKRVYGNWKRLIRGLFIRERLQVKYDLQPIPVDDTKKRSKTSTASSSKKDKCDDSD